WRDALRAAARACGADPGRVLAETDASDAMEGLYIKVEEDGRTVARYKWVRPDFLTAILDSGTHWLDRPLVANGLADPEVLYAGVRWAVPGAAALDRPVGRGARRVRMGPRHGRRPAGRGLPRRGRRGDPHADGVRGAGVAAAMAGPPPRRAGAAVRGRADARRRQAALHPRRGRPRHRPRPFAARRPDGAADPVGDGRAHRVARARRGADPPPPGAVLSAGASRPGADRVPRQPAGPQRR